MPERKACTFCGREGHRAGQCRQRKAAVLVLVRWLHQHPDTLTTGAALIALACGLILIVGA